MFDLQDSAETFGRQLEQRVWPHMPRGMRRTRLAQCSAELQWRGLGGDGPHVVYDGGEHSTWSPWPGAPTGAARVRIMDIMHHIKRLLPADSRVRVSGVVDMHGHAVTAGAFHDAMCRRIPLETDDTLQDMLHTVLQTQPYGAALLRHALHSMQWELTYVDVVQLAADAAVVSRAGGRSAPAGDEHEKENHENNVYELTRSVHALGLDP